MSSIVAAKSESRRASLDAPMGPSFDDVGRQVARVMLAHDDDFALGQFSSQNMCGLQPARSWHAYVQQDEVWQQHAGQSKHLGSESSTKLTISRLISSA
jgi:hypothetical protein